MTTIKSKIPKEVSFELVNKISSELAKGSTPATIADKFNIPTNRVSSLGKLLGYEFIASNKRNPFEWFPISEHKRAIIFGVAACGLPLTLKSYRVTAINQTTKTITVQWQ